MKCLIEAGAGLLDIEYHSASKMNDPDLTIHLDKIKIESVGQKALASLLHKLQIYRCTAEVSAGSALYEGLTRVDDVHLKWRLAVVSKRESRPLFVQSASALLVTFVEAVGVCPGYFEMDYIHMVEPNAKNHSYIQSYPNRLHIGRKKERKTHCTTEINDSEQIEILYEPSFAIA